MLSNTDPNQISMIGQTQIFLDLLEASSKLARIDYPIIIQGERGTGKELIAHRLHYLSERWEHAFVKVNCATFTESLLESELFGHEAGAYTGAKTRRIGRIERAHGGTLFLDEISSSSPALQEKLLRVVEYGELERLGGQASIRVDVRIVAASHINLWDLASKGLFRQDLLDRLSFDLIEVPSLRQRRDDILLLAEHFALKAAQQFGKDVFPGFSERACKILLNYSWPGNIRQLRNVVARSLFRHEVTDPLEQIHFLPGERGLTNQMADEQEPSPNQSDNISSIVADIQSLGLRAVLDKIELDLLESALSRVDHKQSQAAAELGISYHQLRGLLRKHKIGSQRQLSSYSRNANRNNSGNQNQEHAYTS